MNEPTATVLLLFVTFGISAWAFENPQIEQKLIFRPENILAGKEYYRLVTSAFLHAGWGHLLLNMYTLYCFGGAVERWFGSGHFLIVYFGSVLGGSLLSVYIHRHHEYAAYGASGGVCGLIFADILAFPHSRMLLFPLPVAVPGWLFAIAFVIASFYAMKVDRDNIGHDAHLGGAIIGLCIAALLQPDLLRRQWPMFVTIFLLASLLLAYVVINPVFLPIASVIRIPSFSIKPRIRSVPQRAPARAPQKSPNAKLTPTFSTPATNWLIEAMEEQVGKLQPDVTGVHDWVDKFGRTYDIVGARAEHFNLQAFKAAVLDHLNTPTVKFVIVDTRQLRDEQVALLRPFIADLPDAQFHRLIRSYGFTSRQRH